mgnify:CR=1 FL=1
MDNAIKNITSQLKSLLDEVLFLNGQTNQWSDQMSLLGNVHELDSMSVMNVISAIEIKFGIFVEDEDINADVFATIESLAKFIIQKVEYCHLKTA